MKRCPCEKCLCLPICQGKEYGHLVHDCIKVWKYITNIPLSTFVDDPYQINPYLVKVYTTLKPEKWIVKNYHGTNKDISLIELNDK